MTPLDRSLHFSLLLVCGPSLAQAAVAGERIVSFAYESAPLACVEEASFTCDDLGGFFLQPGDRVGGAFVIDEALFGGALNGRTVRIETSGNEWVVGGAPQASPPGWLLSFDNSFDFPGEISSVLTFEVDAALKVSDWSFTVLGDPDSFFSSPAGGDRYEYFGSIVGAEDRLFTSGGEPGRWTTTVIPLPATLWLTLTGLGALFLRRQTASAKS